MTIEISTLSTPIGDVVAAHRDGRLVALELADRRERLDRHLRRHHAGATVSSAEAPRWLATALDGFFDGDPRAFDHLELAASGTPFERRVWDALLAIPFGATTTYGTIAAELGNPAASRAVGAAVGANPIAIVVPCHRVVGKDGSLTGYAGGIDRKRWLLQHEAGARLPFTTRQSRGVNTTV